MAALGSMQSGMQRPTRCQGGPEAQIFASNVVRAATPSTRRAARCRVRTAVVRIAAQQAAAELQRTQATQQQKQHAGPQQQSGVEAAGWHSQQTPPNIYVAIRWPGQLGGSEVTVAGTWDGWQNELPLHHSLHSGDFVRTLALPEGTYQYKFKVDGVWKASPCDPIVASDPGNYNNQRLVHGSHTLTWSGLGSRDEVMVVGDWSGWADGIPLAYNRDLQAFAADVALQPGEYHYRYLVNGAYCAKDSEAHSKLGSVHVNKVAVAAAPAFYLFYSTGWTECTLRYRFTADGPDAPWQERPMYDAPSRATPSGGCWKTITIPAPDIHTAMEFSIAGPPAKKGQPQAADYGPAGAGYVLDRPGGWKLHRGYVWRFERAMAPPILLCSDIDGTMIGDDARADERTSDFTNYWENEASLASSVLVYNTGRSLGQFERLWRDKGGVLALPDVLITAVGTKIWHLADVHRGHSTNTESISWREDAGWCARLDDGWDMGIVKGEAQRILDRHHQRGEERVQWLDKGHEHPHRIALSAHVDLVPGIIEDITRALEGRVKARVITSGAGDWRYVDVVAHLAGKLEALEYVRALYGVPRSRCVAAGDSCNDILMLEGGHPSIIVGNAQRELLDWYRRQPNQDGVIVRTTAPYASGILEGLARHGLY